MNEEQKTEWLEAAKAMLNDNAVEGRTTEDEQWQRDKTGIMRMNKLYRPMPEPKMIRICWDNDIECIGATDANDKPPLYEYDNLILVSTDDLLKIDRS